MGAFHFQRICVRCHRNIFPSEVEHIANRYDRTIEQWEICPSCDSEITDRERGGFHKEAAQLNLDMRPYL